MTIKIGDHVTFHALYAAGAEMWACPAIVVDVYPQADADEPLALVLDVTFPDEAFAAQDAAGKRQTVAKTFELPTQGEQLAQMLVTDGGFVSRQSHVTQATQDPPESGSWSIP